MATTYTTNYHLGMQTDTSDKFDMSVITDNMLIIDNQMKQNETNIALEFSALTELIDGGPKNILKFTNYQTNGMGSLPYTVNSDGTLTFTGSTGSGAGTMWCDCTFSEAKPLVISGSLNSSGITFRLRTTSNADVAVDSGSGAVFTPTVGTTYRAFIRFDASKTYDNVTVKPMICAKTYWDISQAYAPYRPSYQELYDMVLALQSGTRSLSVEPSEEEMR